MQWARMSRPDVLLGSEQKHHQLLASAKGRGVRCPRFIYLNVDPTTELSGIDQGHDKVGEHAAALLHLKILQRETGVPIPRHLLLVDCLWKEGVGRWRLDPPRRSEDS